MNRFTKCKPMNKNIAIDVNLISKCGLYCGACGKYRKGKCAGCNEKTNAQWCKVRACVEDQNLKSCADCTSCKTEECKKLNNFVAKIFSIIFKSDRDASIKMLKEKGADYFAEHMAKKGLVAIKKKK